MKKILALTLLTSLTLAGAQSLRPNAPDFATVDVGVTAARDGTYRPALHLYGNASVTERLTVNRNGSLWGTVTVGNTYNDYQRVFVDGQLDYTVRNVTLYGALRQGFYANNNVGNYGTSIRLGTKVSF